MQTPTLPISSAIPNQEQFLYREHRTRRHRRRAFRHWLKSRRVMTSIIVLILFFTAVAVGIFIGYTNPAVPGAARRLSRYLSHPHKVFF